MPSNVRVAVVKRLLEGKGYMLVRTHGSHHTFTKPGAPNVGIVEHRKQVLYVYDKKAQQVP
jgi:predicted RNA binding protein YcfA (HicA-like mRNA interferase family)